LVHGVAAHKEALDVMARFLARQRVVVLNFDLPGTAESRTVQADNSAAVAAAQTFLRQQPWVRADQIALIGHSLGAQAVLAVAEESPKLALFAALGYHPPVLQTPPCQAFYGAGRYDVLHPPALLHKPLVLSPCRHTFWVSPTADHTTVMSDALTLQALWRWLQQEWGQAVQTPDMRDIYARWGSGLYGVGFLGLALSGLAWLSHRQRLWLLVLMGGGAWVLAELHMFAAWDAASVLICLLLLMLLLPWISSQRLGYLGGMILTLGSLWLLTEVLQAGVADFWALPILFVQSLLHWPLAFLSLLRPWLFDSYSDRLYLSWVWGLLVGAEYARPGVVLAPLVGLSERWVTVSPGKSVSFQRLMALLLLLLIFCGVMVWRWQQGYVYQGGMREVGRVLTLALIAVGATVSVGRGVALYTQKRAAREGDPL
jgi:pimeloyl-ACP methyl ester carboxylesterase